MRALPARALRTWLGDSRRFNARVASECDGLASDCRGLKTNVRAYCAYTAATMCASSADDGSDGSHHGLPLAIAIAQPAPLRVATAHQQRCSGSSSDSSVSGSFA